MRYLITITLLMLSLVSKAQHHRLELGMGYIFSAPRGTMNESIGYANGFNLNFYMTPDEKRYSFGIEMDFNGYGHDKTRQTYTFEDGSTAPMDIVVNNSFYNVMVAGRYYLMKGKIQPFVTGKVGYSLYSTNLSIYDPDDFDHCEPIDTDVLSEDGSVIFSAGVGLRWEILPKKSPGLLFMNLSANYTGGGTVNYMNVDAPNHNHAAHTSDVYARFLDTQTQVVHEHHVGNVYSSPIELFDFRYMISVRLGKR